MITKVGVATAPSTQLGQRSKRQTERNAAGIGGALGRRPNTAPDLFEVNQVNVRPAAPAVQQIADDANLQPGQRLSYRRRV
jgi:hypothetical protein